MISWDTKGIEGCYRFLNRAWNFQYKIGADKQKAEDKKLESLIHKTIKKVGDDIKALKFNTAVSALMILANELDKEKEISPVFYSIFLILLNPFAPHITEELWFELGFKGFCCQKKWPEYDSKIIEDKRITLIIQINGKVRDKIEVEAGISEEEVKKIALASGKIKTWLEGKEIRKTIFVAGKLVNIVVVEKE
jgi:leucyl-tRNA synthetase